MKNSINSPITRSFRSALKVMAYFSIHPNAKAKLRGTGGWIQCPSRCVRYLVYTVV